jgi:Putative NADH-flavin reductase
MRIAHIGASGEVGKRVVPELAHRGHEVTAISTHPDAVSQHENVTAVYGNIDDPDAMIELLRGHDVVISSVQFRKYDHESLIRAVKESGVPRYFVCGGSGTLFMPGTKVRLMDHPMFPEAAIPFAEAAARFLDRLKAESELDWTYVSPPPPPGFSPGEKRGFYRLGTDEVLIGEDGKPAISYEDYAVAVADEIESHTQHGRFTVGY